MVHWLTKILFSVIAIKQMFSDLLLSDDGSSGRRLREPSGRSRRSVDRTLGNPACPKGLSLPGQVPDPLQARRQHRVEGKHYEPVYSLNLYIEALHLTQPSHLNRLLSSLEWLTAPFIWWPIDFHCSVFISAAGFVLEVANWLVDASGFCNSRNYAIRELRDLKIFLQDLEQTPCRVIHDDIRFG